MNTLTPIKDKDHKIDIIDHVNQDHPQELLAIARCHQSEEIETAKIVDIYQQGVKIQARCKASAQEMTFFIPFAIEGGLEDQILYLAYAAIVRQGTDFSGARKHFFEVVSQCKISENMIRITLKSNTPLPVNYPGYAYAFLLKTLKYKPQSSHQESSQKSWHKRLFDHFFIFLMKYLSAKNRKKLLEKTNRDVRLYTLRKSWKQHQNSTFHDYGYVDIFTHGDSAGSMWSKSLEVGDIIMSRSETPDRHSHLDSGQALLIADETAFPALAGILEQWKNPLPPHIITLSNQRDEQSYFHDIDLPEGSIIEAIVCPAEQQALSVLPVLKKIDEIDVVWGAMESGAAKCIRHYLRNERKIKGKHNHMKAYWNIQSKRRGS